MTTGGHRGRTRFALHAGSWYDGDGGRLQSQLGRWLMKAQHADPTPTLRDTADPVRAIISPHAGYTYSGETAAHAFAHLQLQAPVKRVFLLGPAHHLPLTGCAVSQCYDLDTPLGSLHVDKTVINEFIKTGQFNLLAVQDDEEEHSLEMQLPYLRLLLDRAGRLGEEVSVVPILVGSLSADQLSFYASLLAGFLKDNGNVFIISSDFCHWGRRFGYFYGTPNKGPIHESIEALDRQGIALIEQGDLDGFQDYLARTENTICGRNPILLMLAALKRLSGVRTRFTHYAQSNAARDRCDSSVSYAAATISWPNQA